MVDSININWKDLTAKKHGLGYYYLAKGGVEADYYNSGEFYESHSPEGWLDKEHREYANGLWNSYFKFLYRLGLQHYRISKWVTPKILDYGCGGGWFLRYLADHHPRTPIGLEVAPQAYKAANLAQAYVYKSEEELQEGRGLLRPKFNIIYLLMVLEHIPEPVQFLKQVSQKYLGKDDIIIVSVPNDFSPLQKSVNPIGFLSKVHHNYFQPDSLANVMDHAGFDVVYTGGTFPMELWAKMGFNYFDKPELGSKVHLWRLGLEKFFGYRIFHLYGWLMRKWGWGREIVMVGKKRNGVTL